ncbi:hypothetical protein MITS9509_02702 [Synechococcus sp. MIT S9509]|nr:hypothetical protein MITS9504_02056 [Synechococcus sp. MIT S9504]KZR90413.1 hypothetical protein MITS9509_02702 [Synechococcus sp. MIT S9509]
MPKFRLGQDGIQLSHTTQAEYFIRKHASMQAWGALIFNRLHGLFCHRILIYLQQLRGRDFNKSIQVALLLDSAPFFIFKISNNGFNIAEPYSQT